MSTETKEQIENPAAFPGTTMKAFAGTMYPSANDGMTLRDYFAAKALSGELASQDAETGTWTGGKFSNLATRCYAMADAMLKARLQ